MTARPSSAAEFPGSEALVIRRILDAPREAVWKAWTDPDRLMRWWGPEGFTSPACRIDLRVGGKYLFCMRSPEGKDYWSTGVYRDIVPSLLRHYGYVQRGPGSPPGSLFPALDVCGAVHREINPGQATAFPEVEKGFRRNAVDGGNPFVRVPIMVWRYPGYAS